MHSRGAREELHTQPPLSDPVAEVLAGLEHSVGQALRAGIQRDAIVVDPGIGFGKRAEESIEVLRNMHRFTRLEYPVLVGTSRKSFLGRLSHEGADARLWGTAASVAASVLRGTHIIRVHDVAAMRILVDVLDALA
jgi:dihydropteroate synthase